MATRNEKYVVVIKTAGDNRHPGQGVLGTCRWVVLLAFTFLALLAQGCASAPPRNPLPQDLYAQAKVQDITYARYWGDEPPPYAKRLMSASRENDACYLRRG